MGGPSAEHEISLRSGREVMTYLDRSTFNVRAVVIGRDLGFFFADILDTIPSVDDLSNPASSPVFGTPHKAANTSRIWSGCTAAFLTTHGTFGEDGILQGYLDTLGVPYTGSGVAVCGIAMNKIVSKYLFVQAGLDTPLFSVAGTNHPEVTPDILAQRHGFPCFVKCPQSGSSRLMGRASDINEMKTMLRDFSHEADDILVESAISGIEFSCPVLELPDGSLRALPPIEIRPKNAVFFDYAAKYTDNGSDELVPAPRPQDLLDRIESAAIKAHKIIGCRGFSRTDFIYADDRLYALEINNLPGMTSGSLMPKSFKSQGGTYGELLDIMIKTACNKKRPW